MNTENITINTHSSIRIAGSRILYFDPYEITESAHDADLIFVSHSHYDHLDEKSIAKISKEDTVFFAPASIRSDMGKTAGARKVFYLAPGETAEADGIVCRAVPAYNKLKPFHPKKNAWVGYLVTMDGVTYYVAGDTDALKENESISCDVALVPVGGTYTMNASAAAEFINAIRPAAAIPTHYGSVVGKPEDAEVFRRNVAEDIQVDFKIRF